jgi:hypothetical protein
MTAEILCLPSRRAADGSRMLAAACRALTASLDRMRLNRAALRADLERRLHRAMPAPSGVKRSPSEAGDG